MPELLPFQQRGVDKAISHNGRLLLWVPMGRGKTPMASKISSELNCRRIVVVCKDSGVPVWTRKSTDPNRLLGRDWLEHFHGGLPVIVHNMDKLSPAARKIEWNIQTSPNEVHVWVCVYNTFALDNGIEARTIRKAKKKRGETPKYLENLISPRSKWDLLICDECKRISNKDSAASEAIYQFLYMQQVPYFIPMSGTPGDKGPMSFYAYWKCINRKTFSSYWAYIEHFYTLMTNPFGGQEIVERRLDTMDEWDRVLQKYCYYISDADSSEGLPPLSREKIYCKMLPDQKSLFDDIRENMISVQGDQIVVAQNTLIKMLRLRQILICPKILGNELSVGGAIETVCDILDEGDSNDKHTVIFTPFVKAFDPFTGYLAGRGYKDVYHLHGGISHSQQVERIEAFRRTKGIMLCSIMYAEAFSLEPATRCWFIGYEYSPDSNDQAERRLLRLTTQHPITCNYLTYGTPTDERMTDIIAIKRERIDLSLPQNIQRLIRGEL
jgi:SNF2 family DNA or RNA helicase